MSFSGGTFSINTTGQPVVSGTTISASVFNALTADLATGLSTCILKDGTQTATALVPFAQGISVSQTVGIIGTTTNNNANAGSVGEYIESVVTPVNFPSTGTYKDLTSISLTAGDWDVTLVYYGDANGGTWSAIGTGISTTTGNSAAGLVNGSSIIYSSWANSATTPLTIGGSLAHYRMSLSATTTVYAKLYGQMSAGTPTCAGRLSARRVR